MQEYIINNFNPHDNILLKNIDLSFIISSVELNIINSLMHINLYLSNYSDLIVILIIPKHMLKHSFVSGINNTYIYWIKFMFSTINSFIDSSDL